MDNSDIFTMLMSSGLFVVLLGLVISIIKFGKTWIDSKTAETAARIKDLNIRNAVEAAEDCVSTVVLDMAQTVVDDLKEKSADGKLTNDEIASIQKDALTRVEKLITTDVFNTIDTVFGEAQTWLKFKIEAEVKKLKLAAESK
jgi:Flp pilus assembly secretin CpaC